ncbi:glucose-1-phosphate cytidylyltransferase [Oleidesulfovibrio alaskensis G20]|jgi:glucose-1-phosphate cytidylyltransferase|uniref:Glucose-1-phosphate cytidylyltransferase n=1 Tax=Oleidesulfovibrio alaskensis (strain ATCC BAA-1058 / DSM 17464 / G20) TaxID=207559 RepID=Q30V09_OLEA2|nr:glucose-1-phosphate cytidylyltransferase [Oleidesulfovibrio alaskensis]ABB40487.1 glucose-1-phosphate cytidylyltransferase [Oleidesulfovibrio alaskensis G20]MBG0772740.1 glucose-1-phosphate cytidylyltransferase [Oleidesulfovibrio alaskensis]
MKVIIMCGGKGTRLREETGTRPKPMLDIGGRPILWHIMDIYARQGFKDFILPLGYKGDMIKQYFWEYKIRNSDFTIDLASGNMTTHNSCPTDWRVTMCDTGQDTMKGARISQVARHIDTQRFMVTYGDGVADIDLHALLDFHIRSGNTGTFTGVRMPSRFGAVQTDEQGNILSWQEKPVLNEYINCGFFVFEREFLNYLSDDPSCDLEKEPLERLAAEGRLGMYPHDGFWHCMDTLRDYNDLNAMWNSGSAPWAATAGGSDVC